MSTQLVADRRTAAAPGPRTPVTRRPQATSADSTARRRSRRIDWDRVEIAQSIDYARYYPPAKGVRA
jgi:hypothetical protein